ncbi:MAG TPA: hypothetical protein VGG48_10630 [Rhizomicrobium sp.]|jgi:hypothetical protein
MAQVALYFAWSRPDEVSAPLGVLEDRFPALFELRRMFWPRWEQFAGASDQGIGGFLDNIQLTNFTRFAELAMEWTGNPVRHAERKTDAGVCALDAGFLAGVDTLVVISFDSSRTKQQARDAEVAAVRAFLDDPGHTLFVCPHHDIGDTASLPKEEWLARQEVEFHHHGDHGIPARQCFGDFGLSLLNGLGLQVRNRFGLRPAKLSDGSPAPLEIAAGLDRTGLMEGVTTFNLHPHLPHFERLGDSAAKLDVLARQRIDPAAPPHPFTADGRRDFDALLQSKPGLFPGRVLVCDTTIFSSTVGGLESLQRFWRNAVLAKA